MSWIRNLVQTYDKCKDIVGISDEDQSTMLLPLSHLLTGLDIVVHLHEDGSFHRAEKLQTSSERKTIICIPCSEESESRSGKSVIDFPHPLFDQIKFLMTDKYLENLKKWLHYLQDESKFSIAYRAIHAVYQYMMNKNLLEDLKTVFNDDLKDNLFVAFAVNLDGSLENRLWRMRELWEAWSNYYIKEKVGEEAKESICYVTGAEKYYTEKHPKRINRFVGNAKLISSNDTENFTFRGRFEESSHAVTVSYEASQKAHQTLRWLIAKPSSYRCGSQAIIAWAIDDKTDVPDFYKDTYSIYNSFFETDEEKLSRVEGYIFVDYADKMKKALHGYNTTDKLMKHKRKIALMSTDASTRGRLAVTYYREIAESEYEERIIEWHNTCKWYQLFEKKKGYYIGAPSFKRIAKAVLGKPRSQKDEAYEKLEKNLNEQMLHCMFDGQKIPIPFVVSSVHRVSNPLAFEKSGEKKDYEPWREWETMLCTACALIRKYFYDYRKEEYKMELETSRNDRDYLYGRLLAIADKIESHARFKRGKESNDLGATNALRYMSAFSQHPFRTWNLLFTQQLNPYIQQLGGADGYLNMIGNIKEMFRPGDFESDAALDGRYLLGFFAQRQYFMKKKNKDNEGGEANESNKQN